MRSLAVLLIVIDFSAAILFLSLATSAAADQPARILFGLAALTTLNAGALVALLRR